jgi:muramoyltetrapeptide carboxypeptidase
MRAPSLLFPPRFSVGDVIGLAAPASPPDNPDLIEETIGRFTALGFQVRPGKFLRERTGYLAGGDAERAADINALFADPAVRAIFALRGGYGSCRILPLLDYAAIRANPKPLIGYSDITALHLAILKMSGLVTFHGSNASSAFTPGNDKTCRAMLLEPADPARTSILFARDDASGAKLKTIVPGRASGRLLGGNMTCLLRLIGTPYEPDFHGAILFLEDTGEKAYRIDGMFTHLRLAGVLAQIAGLVIGQFDHTEVEEQQRIADCLHREAERIGLPSVCGAPIGHFAEQIMVPQGVDATLDADEAKLSFTPPSS